MMNDRKKFSDCWGGDASRLCPRHGYTDCRETKKAERIKNMKANNEIQLIDKDGSLYMPNDDLLLYRYPAGDCDKIAWPLTEEQKPQLATAIYDEMMSSDEGWSETAEILLPDGEVFDLYKWLP